MSDHTYDLVQSEAMLREFYEIEKQAGISAGWGRAIGAGVGALGGGLLGQSQAPEGAETSGMIRGALLGAGAGLAGGQLATKAGRTQALQFGQRQLHGATGYLPGRGLLGRGAEGTKWYQLGEKGGKQLKGADRLKALEEMGFDFKKGTKEELQEAAKKSLGEGTFSKYLPEKVRNFWAGRRAASQQAQRQLAEEGMTSLPGLAKGYAGGGLSGNVTPLQAAKMNLVAPGLAMGAGIPALMSAQALNEYRQTGDVKQLAGNMVGNVGFAAGAALPMTAMMGLGSAAGAAGKLVGRGIEAVRGAPPQPPVGQVVPR